MKTFVLLTLACFSTLSASPKLMIGIAGGTGSGKTTMAHKLIESFGDRATLIQQDDYYKDLSALSFEERARQNFDHPDSIDFELLEKHLNALRNDQQIEAPIYNFCNHVREKYTQTIYPTEIIIVEGILVLAMPEIRDLFDLKIFVDTDDDIRLLRRMGRDLSERERDFTTIFKQYITTVKPMHDAFVEPSKRYAHVIIPTLDSNDIGVALVISGVKKELEKSLALTQLCP